MSRSWRKISITIFLSLLILSVLFVVISVNSAPYTAQSVADDYNLPIGQSMFENQSILSTSNSVEVPLISNVGFLSHQLFAFDLQGLLISLTSGVVPFDFTTVSGDGIDSYGNVVDVEGPGFLTIEGDKLTVKEPDNYVWGYSAPYKWLEKTESGKTSFNEEDFVTDFQKVVFGAMFNLHQLGAKEISSLFLFNS